MLFRIPFYWIICIQILAINIGFANDDIFHALTPDSDPSHLRKLLQQGADVNQRTVSGDTPLMVAAMFGRKRLALLLVERGADINAQNNRGLSALHQALYQHKNAKPLFDALVKKGADLEVVDHSGQTVLMMAAAQGHPNIVAHLLSLGKDRLASDKKGDTVLVYAMNDPKKGETTLRWLDISRFSSAQQSRAFLKAAALGHVSMLRWWLKAGVDVNTGAPEKSALSVTRQWEVAKLLLDSGANVNFIDSEGDTALAMAVRREDKDTVRLLLKYAANPNHPPKEILDNAFGGNAVITSMLIAAGAETSKRYEAHSIVELVEYFYDGDTALIELAKQGSTPEARAQLGIELIHGTGKQHTQRLTKQLIGHWETSGERLDLLVDGTFQRRVHLQFGDKIDFGHWHVEKETLVLTTLKTESYRKKDRSSAVRISHRPIIRISEDEFVTPWGSDKTLYQRVR